jgi:shikimate kinase
VTVERPLYLIGFMGAGKSTVGRILSRILDRPFCDLDQEIEIAAGRGIDEIFDTLGEEGFRDLEYAALERICGHPDAVVACGGGIVTDERSVDLLETTGDVVCLAVTADEALSRIAGEIHGRPLLAGPDPAGAASLLGLRERLYERVAGLTVDTVGKSADCVAERISEWLELER